MFIPSTFKRPVSSWKALNLRKTLLMASSVRLKPLNCSRLPCVYAQETLDRKSGSAGMPRPISYAVFCLKKKTPVRERDFPDRLEDEPRSEGPRQPHEFGRARR